MIGAMMPGSLFASLPNLITLGRLVLVPLAIVMIVSDRWTAAFAIFLIAGISDAVDGFLAKRFHLQTDLGAYLDPIADKALLVSIYVTLAMRDILPPALVIIVVSRDVMIVGAIMISWLMGKPVEIRPVFVSKLNTGFQIALAAGVLAAMAFQWEPGVLLTISVWAVGITTVLSAAVYFRQWLSHMMGTEPAGG